MAEPTGQERYQYWLMKAKERGEVFTTRTKAVMKDMFLVNRRENDGLVLPPDIEERRKTQDSLHNIEAKLDKLAAQKKIDGWKFLQSLAVDVAKKIEKLNGS